MVSKSYQREITKTRFWRCFDMADAIIRPHLSAARRAGNLLFMSGQLPLDPQGRLVGDTVGAQTERCLANLETVLAAHGLGRHHIVKTTVWLRPPVDFSAFNAAYGQFFGEDRPARSTVCARLVIPSALVEIEAIATFD
jgi:2-iminobutanoate/2-iminopropanoate deaminase